LFPLIIFSKQLKKRCKVGSSPKAGIKLFSENHFTTKFDRLS